MTPDDLRDLLRNARNAAGLTQESLAVTIGVERLTVISWENGRSLERICSYFRACEALGLEWTVSRPARRLRKAPNCHATARKG